MKSLSENEYVSHENQFETLIDIFSITSQTYPHKIACKFHNDEITYSQLDKKSNAIAHKLKNLNIGQGDIVGVYLPRGINLHIAILGILKTGAAYIPCDSEMPIDRVVSILEENHLKYCFAESNISDSLICIHDDFNSLGSEINFASPENTAYVIFTSGSTGKPKGIPIKHYQISILLRSENAVLNIKENDIVYQGFSVSFDMWFEETWLSYLVGATQIIADSKVSKSVDSLNTFLSENKVSILHAVPSLLAILKQDIPSLRLINSVLQ